MTTTDTSERGLERLICRALAGHSCDPPAEGTVADPPAGYGGVGWSGGSFHDYDREYCVDLVQLAAFLRDTQPEASDSLALSEDGPTRRAFLTRLQGEIGKRGTIDVLRNGIKHRALQLDLFYGTPSEHNAEAQERFAQNRFTVTRQLRYSRDEGQRSLDIGLFINGLPVFTFELKNSLTKQTADDAVLQYQQDRNPREKLFEFGRCIGHFAVDEREVQFCTDLKGKASWFLPFNRGWNDGAGNPPNPHGLAIDYLWREVLPRESLTNILENYAQVVEEKDDRTGQEAAGTGLAALPPARRGAPLAGRRRSPRSGPALLDPALGRQRQEQLHRLAGAPTHRTDQGRRAGVRLDHRGDRPAHPRPADPRHHPAVCPGVGDRRSRRPLGRPAAVHRERQEDHHFHGAEVPVHSRRDRQRAARAQLRDHHRRGALQPGRTYQRGDGAGAVGGRRGGRGGDLRGPDQPPDGVAQAAAQRQLLRVYRHAQEQDAGDLRHPGPAAGRDGEASRIPQLHDETGDRGGLHPRRGRPLHAGGQLLPVGQDSGG